MINLSSKLFRKKVTEYEHSPEAIQSVVSSYKFIPFSAYGVSILHPDSWNIFITPNKPFVFHDGAVKIDRSFDRSSPDSEISLSVRWAKLSQIISVDDYISEIQNQYAIKQKKNKRDNYKILEIKPEEGFQHKTYSITSRIVANHSVYRKIGRASCRERV